MTLDQIMKILGEIEDRAEFDRLWAMLGEIVVTVAKARVNKERARNRKEGNDV